MAVRIVEYGLHLISPPLIELKVLVIIGKPIITIGKLFPLKSNGRRFEMVTQYDCVNNCITLALHISDVPTPLIYVMLTLLFPILLLYFTQLLYHTSRYIDLCVLKVALSLLTGI